MMFGTSFVLTSSYSANILTNTGSVNTMIDPSIASAYWSQVTGATDASANHDDSGWQ